MPWHYTTNLDLIDHWQTLITGILALIAAAATIVITLQTERRKSSHALDALRKSIAVELRLIIPNALGSYVALKRLSEKADGPITARMVESFFRLPIPVVYPANANKIGLLEGEAMNVAIIYSLLEVGRDSVSRLLKSRTPDDINAQVVLATAGSLLAVCRQAHLILPKIRTGVADHDNKDTELLSEIARVLT